MNEHKVIFHIDEMEKWPLLLANVKNLSAASQESISTEVVANSEAVKYYTQNTLSEIKKLSSSGVIFCACANALRSLNIPAESLPDYIQIVPAGVLELMERQEEGYCYIKP